MDNGFVVIWDIGDGRIDHAHMVNRNPEKEKNIDMALRWATEGKLRIPEGAKFTVTTREKLPDTHTSTWRVNDWDHPAITVGEHPQEVLSKMVERERDRRINDGVTFQGVLFQTDQNSRNLIAAARELAVAALTRGKQTGDLRWTDEPYDFAWRATDNTELPMDAETMVAFGDRVTSYRLACMRAASSLKSGTIPENYNDDQFWPTR